MDRIAAETDLDQAAKDWGNLDETILRDYAPIFPLLNEKAIFLVGKNVKGAFMHAFYGEPDVSALSVA